MSRFTFSKSKRIVRSDDFRVTFETGIHAADDSLVIVGVPNNRCVTRLGLAVSKRVGNAPVRNRWKRIIRDAFRISQHNLPAGYDLVVRPRKCAQPNHARIVVSIQRLANKIARKHQPKSANGKS